MPISINAREHQSYTNVTSNIKGGLLHAATREEIKELRRQGIKVDEDNKPVPKNTQLPAPQGNDPPPGTWEKPAYCPRQANTNFSDQKGRFVNHRWDAIANYDNLDLFWMCFPEDWIIEVLTPMTNKELSKKMDLQEFYVFLGCIFFMACYEGIPDHDLWWLLKPIDMFERAPFRLNAYMMGTQFNKIQASLQYTNKEAPLFFLDQFHKMRQMIDAFNNHYSKGYKPSWPSCINESMNTWLNNFCPGFMTLPCKPHPFRNEYHTIPDRDNGKSIMWSQNC